jgi:hypothetical protein
LRASWAVLEEMTLDGTGEGIRISRRPSAMKRGRPGARLGSPSVPERKIIFSVDRPAPVSRFRNLRSASDGGAGNAIEISVLANLPAAFQKWETAGHGNRQSVEARQGGGSSLF